MGWPARSWIMSETCGDLRDDVADLGRLLRPFSVHVADPPEDADRKEDVHDDACRNHEHPGGQRLGTKLPRLRRMLEVIGVEALIDHPRDLHISPDGNP